MTLCCNFKCTAFYCQHQRTPCNGLQFHFHGSFSYISAFIKSDMLKSTSCFFHLLGRREPENFISFFYFFSYVSQSDDPLTSAAAIGYQAALHGFASDFYIVAFHDIHVSMHVHQRSAAVGCNVSRIYTFIFGKIPGHEFFSGITIKIPFCKASSVEYLSQVFFVFMAYAYSSLSVPHIKIFSVYGCNDSYIFRRFHAAFYFQRCDPRLSQYADFFYKAHVLRAKRICAAASTFIWKSARLCACTPVA